MEPRFWRLSGATAIEWEAKGERRSDHCWVRKRGTLGSTVPVVGRGDINDGRGEEEGDLGEGCRTECCGKREGLKAKAGRKYKINKSTPG